MSKLTVVAAFALGYVAGSAAGRERYETIKSGAQRVTGDPRVRSAAGAAASRAKDAATTAATTAASAVADQVRGHDDDAAPSSPEPATGRTPLS
jgi:hypothetical protein